MTAPACPPGSSDAFLNLVRRTGAADPRRLDAFLQRQPDSRSPHDAKALAATLVRDNVLTDFQAKRLLAGKPDDLVLGKYEVVDLLGSGTMSSVFLCRHPAMDRWVAVKLLANGKAASPQLLKRFHREARAAATLCHPNIVHAFDFVEDDKGLFLVMEYVDGSTLRAVVANHAPLSPRRAAVYASHAAAGLQHAHEAGMVHRDVKPGNIMLERTGGVKLLDLGLTLLLEDSTVLTQGVLGTVDYLAPEQTIDSHKVDARADVYGLGATLYYCLTGRPPCGEGTVAQKVLAHRSRQPLPLRSFRSDVPPELEAVVLRMLAKSPDARLPSMVAVREALATWARDPLDPPAAAEMPKWTPTIRSAVPDNSPPPTSELPVVPRSGLIPLPPRVQEKARAEPLRPATEAAQPAAAALSAYSSPSRREPDTAGLRPLVFPTLPPSNRPPSPRPVAPQAGTADPDSTPRREAPSAQELSRPVPRPVAPPPGTADQRGPTPTSAFRTTLVTMLVVVALGAGALIGLVVSRLGH